MRESRMELLLRRAKEKELTPIKIKDLWEKQEELLNPPENSEFWEKKEEILNRHGYNLETWKEVLRKAGTLYFAPTTGMEECNEEIKKLCEEYEVMNPAFKLNYLHELAKQAMKPKKRKNQRVIRWKDKEGIYVYDYQE